MATNPDPPVNPQITDAVTQANVKVLGDAPAMAMAQIEKQADKAAHKDEPDQRKDEQHLHADRPSRTPSKSG